MIMKWLDIRNCAADLSADTLESRMKWSTIAVLFPYRRPRGRTNNEVFQKIEIINL